ncbi:retrovirus-related pol polyprotein from transposon TNT 1-94 [Tanacetum coccineum]
MFVPTGSTLPTLQTAEDLQGDELLHYDAEIELMNLNLNFTIPNEIYILSGNPSNYWEEILILCFQEEVVEGSNAQNETENVQRTLRTSSLGNTSTVQCYNCSGKGHYARNCPKPRVRDSKYFMEQMLQAKQDEAGELLTDEHNDFLFADASRMEEIKELSANICLMARIQPANNTSDAGLSYDSAFISEVQSSSINENKEQMYPIHTKIINSTIGDDQIDSNIIFDEPNGNVNSGSVEKDTHVPDLYALEQLARNAYKEAEKQQLFAQKVQQQNTTLTSQLELYKERVRVLENIKGKQRKSKKASHPPKLVPSDHSKLELFYTDLCGPMMVASINGKKYILVIVDDYSRYTWVYFLYSKDETPEIIKKFIAQTQLNYKAKVCKIRTDNGTKFKHATLKAHYENLGIMQQFLTACTPQQNGVVERRNRTLIEAARTMIIFS